MNICFTGHRPNKLGGYNWNSSKNQDIMYEVSEKIMDILEENENEKFYFITGGALGIDQMAFHICHKLKGLYENITTEIAIPFKNQPNKWFNSIDIERYNHQLQLADKIVYIDTLDKYKLPGSIEGEYSAAKLQIRNKYMVDNSDLVIAVWDGSKSGTKNCIDYAKKNGKRIIVIDPNSLEISEM